jgi:predicted NBD/HSP70 family sugar kinase
VVTGLRHQKEKRSMDHFAGLDVSVNETSICIVDDTGRIIREAKVASEPAAQNTRCKNFQCRLVSAHARAIKIYPR